MKFVPEVKSAELTDKICICDGVKWSFADETDERVIKAARRTDSQNTGVGVHISHENKDSEGYVLEIDEDKIFIRGDSPAGAFYALMTLKMMKKSYNGRLPCGIIRDYPDMRYRGFYQDTTRGRVPTLGTLKKLADTMSEFKLNSLQLYVEHSYEFEEYKHCREKLGYLTKAEISELDSYCRERFIELIPSLSTFGHLYHLLQSDNYKHLCELKNYEPTRHYWAERMLHHTINPVKEESFRLITSLAEQHIEAFSSNYFNICCDETFDLCKDINKDKDKAELYINFVKKLVSYLEAKGKTVMMWGDIVLQYPERISELSDKIIFLNWDYSKEPNEEKVAALSDRRQIVCPGTGSWHSFCEQPALQEDNITVLSKYGHKYGALGMLNTNWGDYGNPASVNMAMYGLILGAVMSWDKAAGMNDELRSSISEYYYGNSEAAGLLYRLSEAGDNCGWVQYLDIWDYKVHTGEQYQSMIDICEEIAKDIKELNFDDELMKSEFITAAEGQALLNSWHAKKFGFEVKCNIDFEKWIEEYKRNWLKTTKQSELEEMIRVLREVNSKQEV